MSSGNGEKKEKNKKRKKRRKGGCENLGAGFIDKIIPESTV